jgi:hypothetical protein
VKIPINFDGAKFAKKYNLGKADFWVDSYGDFRCPSLPDLKAKDLEDCILLPPSIEELRKKAYRKAFSNEDFIEAYFEYTFENKPQKMQALQEKRESVKMVIK